MREQEIKEKFIREFKERQKRAWNLISEKHKNDGERYRKAFQEKLEEVLRKFYEYQKDETKKLKYVYVNCLRTSLETGTYEYIIRVMDERKYADDNLIEEYYVPAYMKELIDDDTEYFTKLIMSKIIRAKKYEVRDFLRDYLWSTYMEPLPREISKVMSELKEMEVYRQVEKAEMVEGEYGEVLERPSRRWIFTKE